NGDLLAADNPGTGSVLIAIAANQTAFARLPQSLASFSLAACQGSVPSLIAAFTPLTTLASDRELAATNTRLFKYICRSLSPSRTLLCTCSNSFANTVPRTVFFKAYCSSHQT